MEDLQFEVEELIYKSDDQKLLLLAQHLKLEESDFVGKTKRLIVKNVKKEIDVRLETTEEEDSLALLMEIRSKLVESSDKQDTDEVPEDMKSDEKANKEELEKAQSDLLEMQKKFKEMME